MAGKIKVLGIVASPHKDGRGAKLLKEALGQARKQGASTSTCYLADIAMPHHHGNLGVEGVDESIQPIVRRMKAADAIIFVIPVYWFGINDLIASFLAHLTPLEHPVYEFEGKVAGIIATCQEDGGQTAIASVWGALANMGFVIPPYGGVIHNFTMAHLSEGTWQETDIPLLGANVVRLAEQIQDMEWSYGGMAS